MAAGRLVLATARAGADPASRLRTLRPPIAVDVFPSRPGEPGKGRAELVPLGIDRSLRREGGAVRIRRRPPRPRH